MATRFYLQFGTTPSNPVNDAGWNIVTSGRNLLEPKNQQRVLNALADLGAITIPITTTQNIACRQFVSNPIPPQIITGTFSLVIRCFESAITANAFLAVVARVVGQNYGGLGDVVRGTLFSVFSTDTEFALSGAAATRIVNAQAVTQVQSQPGDRIVVEIGVRAVAPTAAGSYTMRWGSNAASDFALTSGLTTDLNPWCEFSQDLFTPVPENYKSLKAGSGISTTERIR